MASIVSFQNSLSAGELTPSLYGRTDLEKWHSGTATCRNFYVDYRGGISTRAGLAYVGTCLQAGDQSPPRLIPFQFSLTQGYVLEFGDQYMRIIFEGAYVLDSSNSIVTVVAPYAASDLPYLKFTQSADTMTLTCVNTVTSKEYPPYSLVRSSNTVWTFTAETFASTITAPATVTATAQSSSNASTWYSYVVTAVDSKTGEESNPSNPVNIQNNDIGVYQGSNTISWTPVAGASSYNVYKATPSYSYMVPVSSLYGFMATALGPSTTDTNITADFTIVPSQHSDPFVRGTITDVVPTAVGVNYSQQTVGWSVATSTGTGFNGTPVVVNGGVAGFLIKDPGKNYTTGDTITFTDSGGGLATGTFALLTVNPTDGDIAIFNNAPVMFKGPVIAFNALASGNLQVEIEKTIALTIQNLANTLNASNSLTLSVATYSASGNTMTITYKTPGTVGNSYSINVSSSHGTASGATLTGGGTVGSGATATLTVGPKTGTFPSVPAYFQQRRIYGNSLNDPDTYWMSQPGLFSNMDSSIPVTDADSITGTPWAQQVNGLQWLVPMPGGLVVLTGKGAWQLNGGSSAAITPSNQVATPQAYNGCNATVPPIVVNYDILYVQAKGSIVRDLSYNFYTNIYTGTDLTVLSNHLFLNKQVVQWAWAEEPFKLAWLVMNDGSALSLTYLKEQEVVSWTRHDTNGQFISVCSITEPPVDAVYFVVKRYVLGGWRYYVERMDNRLWSDDPENSFCVDSGLVYPQSFPAATLSPAAATGTGISFKTNLNVFNGGDVGSVIRVGGGKGNIVGFVSATEVIVDITQNIVTTVPDDPNNMPEPAISGNWSIAVPVTAVSGLNHLEGMTVAILADGSVMPNQTVSSGAVTLTNAASQIVIGLPYICQAQTLYIDHQEPNTVQTRRKDISSVGLRVSATRGLEIGADQPDASAQPDGANIPWTNMNEIKERTQFAFAGNAIPLFTGDYYKNVTSGWSVKGQIALQQKYPLPANILAVAAYWTVGDDV